MTCRVRELYQKFDSLSDSEKGTKIGYCIGKYGVDIFAGGATLKCISAMERLKKANRLANLEALASTETSKEAVKAAAMVQEEERAIFLKPPTVHKNRVRRAFNHLNNPNPNLLVTLFVYVFTAFSDKNTYFSLKPASCFLALNS